MFNFIAKLWYYWHAKKNLKTAVSMVARDEYCSALNDIKLARKYDNKGGGELKEKICTELKNALKQYVERRIDNIILHDFNERNYEEAVLKLKTLKRCLQKASNDMLISKPEPQVSKMFVQNAATQQLKFEGKAPETIDELITFICQTGLDNVMSFLPTVHEDYDYLHTLLNNIRFYCSVGGLEYPQSIHYFENLAHWAEIEKFTKEAIYSLRQITEYAHKLKMSFDFRELEAVQRKIESITKRVGEEKLKTATN